MNPPERRPRGGVVLLAAGRSRRFGSDKRAYRLADGRTLLTHSLERYGGAFEHCVVVIRSDDPEPEFPTALVTLPKVVRAANADLGMGHSLAAGAAAAEWDYLFLALADMPWILPATLAELRGVMERALLAGASDTIVQPVHAGTPGHPVGFARRYFEALRGLTGDAGARSVLQRHGKQIHRLDVTDPGVLRDLDSPDQLPAHGPSSS